MAFAEKSAWASLCTVALIYGAYFACFYALGIESGLAAFALFTGAVIVHIIAMIVLHSVFAKTSLQAGDDPGQTDERDAVIAHRAERYAGYILSAGVILVIMALLAGVNATAAPVNVAHVLFAFFVVSELVNYGTQVASYRRAA